MRYILIALLLCSCTQHIVVQQSREDAVVSTESDNPVNSSVREPTVEGSLEVDKSDIVTDHPTTQTEPDSYNTDFLVP